MSEREMQRIRRENRRLRWKKGNYVLRQFAAYSYRPNVRRDVVRSLLRTRQWRLAVTAAVMPSGYSLRKVEDRV